MSTLIYPGRGGGNLVGLGRTKSASIWVAASTTAPSATAEPQSKWQRIASLGAAGILTWVTVKLLKIISLSSLAWYLVAKQTGMSPLRHWGRLLTAYASVYVASMPVLPFKYAMVVGLTPAVDGFLFRLARRLQVSRSKACLVCGIVIAISGCALWALTIALASCLAGIPS